MESRSNLIKSKSSNSAITTRSGLKESTRSNLQFQKNVIKKRGVYVENKATKTRLASPEATKQDRAIKSPPRPPRGRKTFLASVLTILSKNTTSTQCPDNNHNNTTQKRVRRRPDTAKNEDYDNQKKKKYRSKILRNGVGRDERDEQIFVLQPQKEMAHTSSIFSVNQSNNNFSKRPSCVKSKQNKEIEENINNNVNNSLVREILEGKQMKKDRRVKIEDPTTVVALAGTKTTGMNNMDSNKGLYNFFVDLLGTIDMSDDTRTEKQQELSSNASSTKIPLEINESVAKKLDVRCHSPTCGGSTRSPSPENHFYCLNDGEVLTINRPVSPNRKPVKVKKTMKAQSFSVAQKPQPKNMKTESFTINKTSRKRKKETILNMFKEQLKINDNYFEEPQNLFEALKIIADNKRKCQKTIHYEEIMKNKRRDSGMPECVFKRPNVIIRRKKKMKKVGEPIGKQFDLRSYGKMANEYDSGETNESEFSLKVIGYDYQNERQKIKQRTVKEVIMAFHSTPSSSDRALESNDEYDYTDSYFSTLSRAPSDVFELKQYHM